MQLALTPYVLVLLGAGVLVVFAVLLVVLVRARRRQPDTPDPTASDWTGEAATGDPSARPAPAAVSPAMTVADAVAVRDAHTAPLLVTSPASVEEVDELNQPPAAAVAAEPAVAPAAAAPDAAVAGRSAVEVRARDERALDGSPPEDEPQARPVAGRPASDRTGSSRSVAAAVAQALAVRAAAEKARRAATPAPGGDVRDRLLAVLLDDPASAVGATMELEACRAQLDRLSDAVRHQRRVLGDVLGRLSGAGLQAEQLSRLSGLPIDEISELLAGTHARA